jgi:hypothetical protein
MITEKENRKVKRRNENLLMYEYTGEIEKLEQSFKRLQTLLNGFLNAYRQLVGAKPIESTTDLINAVISPTEYYRNGIIESLPDELSPTGIPVSKEIKLSMLQLSSTAQVESISDQVKKELAWYNVRLDVFSLDNGNVIIDEEKAEEQRNAFRIFSEDEDEKEFQEKYNALLNAWGSFRLHFSVTCGNLTTPINQIINSEGKNPAIIIEYKRNHRK